MMTDFSKGVLARKFAQCAETLNLLKEDRKIGSLEAFRKDAHLYHSVCFRFVTVIEALFGAGQVVLSERGKHATGEESIGALLAREGVISEKTAKRLEHMYGFRNRLVHAYGTLDDAKVAEYLEKHLNDIEEVLAALKGKSGTIS